MIITYFGKQFFKVQQGEMIFAFNPISKESKSNISNSFGADLALVTTNHPDYNGTAQLSRSERFPFIINSPGDYEIKEIPIKGIMSWTEIDGKKYINTTYLLSIDEIKIVFLGVLSNSESDSEIIKKISEEISTEIEGVDILFMPVNLPNKSKVIISLEPKIIIPMDYDASSLKAFLKELGQENIPVIDKLTLKRKELENKNSEVVVFKIN